MRFSLGTFLLFFCYAEKLLQECGPDYIYPDRHLSILRGSILKIDRKQIKEVASEFFQSKIKNMDTFFSTGLWVPETEKFLVITRVDTKHRNILYITYYDKDWNLVTVPSSYKSIPIPSIIPIPVHDYNLKHAGPQDPRMFRDPFGEIFIIFNKYDHDGNRKMLLLSLDELKIYPLTIADYPVIMTGNGEYFRIVPQEEKNWAPLVRSNDLFFVYSYDSFQVMNCNDKSICKHVVGKYAHTIYKFKPGTPFLRFGDTDYYFSFSYKHMYCPTEPYDYPHRRYRPTLSVVYSSDKDNFEHIYQSEPIYLFDSLGYHPYTGMKKPVDVQNMRFCERNLIIIVSAITKFDYENDETELLGFFNDHHPFNVKIKGIVKVIRKVIEENEGKYYKLRLRNSF